MAKPWLMDGPTSANSEVNGFRRYSADLTSPNLISEYAASITDCNWVLLMGSQTPGNGASLKDGSVVHRLNELEEVCWTRNSRWHRHSHLCGSKCSWQYEI